MGVRSAITGEIEGRSRFLDRSWDWELGARSGDRKLIGPRILGVGNIRDLRNVPVGAYRGRTKDPVVALRRGKNRRTGLEGDDAGVFGLSYAWRGLEGEVYDRA